MTEVTGWYTEGGKKRPRGQVDYLGCKTGEKRKTKGETES